MTARDRSRERGAERGGSYARGPESERERQRRLREEDRQRERPRRVSVGRDGEGGSEPMRAESEMERRSAPAQSPGATAAPASRARSRLRDSSAAAEAGPVPAAVPSTTVAPVSGPSDMDASGGPLPPEDQKGKLPGPPSQDGGGIQPLDEAGIDPALVRVRRQDAWAKKIASQAPGGEAAEAVVCHDEVSMELGNSHEGNLQRVRITFLRLG